MKIFHRISLNFDPVEQAAFLREGVTVELGLQTAVIEESDPRWPGVSKLVVQFKAVHMVETEYSEEEFREAPCFKIAAWHHGYPNPEDRWLDATYDLADYCSACGIGNLQDSPFMMAGEPRWGRRGVMQLNWVFEEIFVKPEVWADVFEPFGIACLPVLDRKGQKSLETVVQLDIRSCSDVDTTQLVGESCSHCGRIKYRPHARGYFPAPLSMPNSMFRSVQYFGSGGSANRSVFVSKPLYERIQASAIRGQDFKPCAKKPMRSSIDGT